jgi:SAM-dependent methyltransferase
VKSRGGSPGALTNPRKIATCPICHAPDPAHYANGRDRLFGLAHGVFDLFRCVACECVFQHPIPESSALADFYPQEYWWTEEPQSGSLAARMFRKMEKAYREFVTADHVRFLNYCARNSTAGEKLLLDIGCGSGTFLHVARSYGFIPHGMDGSARAVEVAGKQYGYPVRQGEIGSNAWHDYRFDFVTMFHVLEHLPDPRLGLQHAAGLLKPGGTLIVQVPNISSFQARLFGTRWYGLDVPRHVINFSPKALRLLLEEMGFEFRLVARFSLRDNPASIASSIVPCLDPIGRKGRRLDSNPISGGAMEIAYLGAFLFALPPALIESLCGRGGTLWAYARRKERLAVNQQREHN